MFEMNFQPARSFSFTYNTKPSEELLTQAAAETAQTADGSVTVYTVAPEFCVRRRVTEYPQSNAIWIQTEVFNPTDRRSEVISGLCELDCLLPMPVKPAVPPRMHSQGPDAPTVTRMLGTTWDIHEFEPKTDVLEKGAKVAVHSERGASSERNAPFFNLHQCGEGVMLAVGWTGQFNTEFCRNEEDIRVRCQIADTEYYLLAHESLRTASVLIIFYNGDSDAGQNTLRRVIKQHFSPSDRLKDGELAPYCFSLWGGMPSDIMLQRIELAKKHYAGQEYCWIDAGWYGIDEKPCDSESDGWYAQSGNWQVNLGPLYHPDGLTEVSRAIHDAGMKLVLWFHPEISNKRSALSMAHPEWMYSPSESNYNDFVNLGIPEAAQWLTQRIAELIESIGVDCYRQDFCYFPLSTWDRNDKPSRKGICQIKHINALYRMWDNLRERFPHLLIDNCAGGGRRLDIEMMRRSVPLWRSDMQCSVDCDPQIAQCASQGIFSWLPYSGTGCGVICDDVYRVRSCYSPALVMGHLNYKFTDVNYTLQQWNAIEKIGREYLEVQPYLSCDYYPLTQCGVQDDSWVVWQFERPEKGDGIVLALRRKNSPFPVAQLQMRGRAAQRETVLTDRDSGQEITLCDGRLELEIPQKRGSRLLFYKLK